MLLNSPKPLLKNWKNKEMMNKSLEVRICVPSGCRLVGCRTEDDVAVVVFEDARGPEVRSIGFCREHSGEVVDDFEDADCSKGFISPRDKAQ